MLASGTISFRCGIAADQDVYGRSRPNLVLVADATALHVLHVLQLRCSLREGWMRPDVAWREVQSTVLKWPDLA